MFHDNGVFNGKFVIGESDKSTVNLAATDIAIGMKYTKDDGSVASVPIPVGSILLDSVITDYQAQNLIVIGKTCTEANTVAAQLLPGYTCTMLNDEYTVSGDPIPPFSPGQGYVKLIQHPNGNYAMLVTGWSYADIRFAGKIIAQKPQLLQGTELLIEGTTVNTATIKLIK
tara:strand:- start:3 stop:515 length:513 start_codon:yes stop_codon:yes gene_type:complete